MEPNQQLAITLPAVTKLVAGIDPSQLDNPTACANFTVRGVIDHLLGGATAFAPRFRGQQPGDTEPQDVASTGRDVPTAAVRHAMSEVLEAINSPGAMERTVDAPFG
ncbi:MAG: maleylpyruvate isomerase N-terminal domain-containing protein [Acidimicrobiales bacterium]